MKAKEEAKKQAKIGNKTRKTNLFDKYRAPLKEPLAADYQRKNWAKMQGVLKKFHEKREWRKPNLNPKGLKRSKLYRKGHPYLDPEMWDKPDTNTPTPGG